MMPATRQMDRRIRVGAAADRRRSEFGGSLAETTNCQNRQTPPNSQHSSNTETTRVEYTGVRGARWAATRISPARRSRARPWSRCQPSAHTADPRSRPCRALDPSRYAAAILFVTAYRSPIESSIDQRTGHHTTLRSLREATTPGRRRFLVSQSAHRLRTRPRGEFRAALQRLDRRPSTEPASPTALRDPARPIRRHGAERGVVPW